MASIEVSISTRAFSCFTSQNFGGLQVGRSDFRSPELQLVEVSEQVLKPFLWYLGLSRKMNLHSTGPSYFHFELPINSIKHDFATIKPLLKPQIQNIVQELRLASLCWKKIVQDFWLPALPYPSRTEPWLQPWLLQNLDGPSPGADLRLCHCCWWMTKTWIFRSLTAEKNCKRWDNLG